MAWGPGVTQGGAPQRPMQDGGNFNYAPALAGGAQNFAGQMAQYYQNRVLHPQKDFYGNTVGNVDADRQAMMGYQNQLRQFAAQKKPATAGVPKPAAPATQAQQPQPQQQQTQANQPSAMSSYLSQYSGQPNYFSGVQNQPAQPQLQPQGSQGFGLAGWLRQQGYQ